MTVIEKWLNDPAVERFHGSDGNVYGIRVLGRGDNLFFQENGQALICEIDAVNSIIYAKSVTSWSNSKKMSDSEKARVLILIEQYYKRVYKKDLRVVA